MSRRFLLLNLVLASALLVVPSAFASDAPAQAAAPTLEANAELAPTTELFLFELGIESPVLMSTDEEAVTPAYYGVCRYTCEICTTAAPCPTFMGWQQACVGQCL